MGPLVFLRLMEFQRFVHDVNSMIQAPQPIMDVPGLQKSQSFAQFTAEMAPAAEHPQECPAGSLECPAGPQIASQGDTPPISSHRRSKADLLEEMIRLIKEEFEQEQQQALDTLKKEALRIKELELDIEDIRGELGALQHKLEERTQMLQQASTAHMAARHVIDDAAQDVEHKIQRLEEAFGV